MNSEKKVEMRVLDPEYRRHSIDEVSLGYSKDEALIEASRCLNCKNKPCVQGCPVNIDIPAFIKKIKEEKFDEALTIIEKESSLSRICGRVCPQESQCEKYCVRGIKGESLAIGRLERFVSDNVIKNNNNIDIVKNGKKVAIIGSGPSGLSCSYDLIKLGYDVTIYEALHLNGGVLIYGIPEFRLPKKIVSDEIDKLKNLGVKFINNCVIGKTLLLSDLINDYDAIFIGSGAGLPRFMNIPGENLNGVLSANEFLTRFNLMKAYLENAKTPIFKAKKYAVVGGGNVAMDAARCALRLGASEVHIIYRRSMNEIPARLEEVIHAKEEGIIFDTLVLPVEIIGDENHYVSKINCVRMELGEHDESGRRSPVEIPDSLFSIDCDAVIMAIGTSPNPLLKETSEGLITNKRGCLVVNEDTLETSIENVYAGGDAVTGAATVILACGSGKKAAEHINEKLSKRG
ncbi:MAG: NADPH-dependent glutamate synthase [Bacilli bacterium]|nr:NADPH-dependent glutamate synthase [Bacilli bacterium]